MKYHQGRLIDHLHLRVSNLDAAKAFYRAVLGALERGQVYAEEEHCFFADELYVDEAEDQVSHVHLAFEAADRDMVDRFHAVALQSGGRDNGAPGLRSYHKRYYAAFVLDPDGNNLEAVWHGPTRRSAESVRIERLDQA